MAAPIGKTSLAARVGQHTVRLRYGRRVADSDALIGLVPPTQLTRRMIIGLGLAAPTLAMPWLAGCAPSDPDCRQSTPAPGTPSSAAMIESYGESQLQRQLRRIHRRCGGTGAGSGSARSCDPGRTAPQAALEGPPTASDVPSQRAHGTRSGNHQSAANACAGQDRRNVARTARLPCCLVARHPLLGHYRSAALKANGSDALLWGSLSVAAASFASGDRLQ